MAKDGVGTLGPYGVRLVALGAWDRLIFVRDAGIPGVFAGFLIICLSAALMYLASSGFGRIADPNVDGERRRGGVTGDLGAPALQVRGGGSVHEDSCARSWSSVSTAASA